MSNNLRIIRITINGEEKEVAVDPKESLADMLRKRLGMTSVKKGCEVGECGACTVLLNNRAVQSCIQLAIWADGCAIKTLEGLNSGGELHPFQRAFMSESAVQCGFCTPGFIMIGLELWESGKSYSREEIKKYVEGHLCRCTGYENILNALELALSSRG